MKIRIAMAGYLLSDQHLFGKIDLLLGHLTGYLCKNNANAEGDDYWMFTVSSFRAGTDMLFSHFLSSGSKEEVVAYMKGENERQTIADSVNELSKKVDSKY